MAVRYNSDGTYDTTYDPVQHDAALSMHIPATGLRTVAGYLADDGNLLLGSNSSSNNAQAYSFLKIESRRNDLAVSTISDASHALLDGLITYTIQVSNTGDDATFASIRELIPAHTEFVSLTAPVGWAVSELKPDGSIVAATRNLLQGQGPQSFVLTVRLVGALSANQSIVNVVSAGSSVVDYNTTNNTATTTDVLRLQFERACRHVAHRCGQCGRPGDVCAHRAERRRNRHPIHAFDAAPA